MVAVLTLTVSVIGFTSSATADQHPLNPTPCQRAANAEKILASVEAEMYKNGGVTRDQYLRLSIANATTAEARFAADRYSCP